MSDNKYKIKDPVVELQGSDFNDMTLVHKDFKNKNALIKFYAPWCPHCTDMVADLNFLAKGLSSHGFKIGAVNLTNNSNKEISQKCNVSGIPSLFMANPKGELNKLEISDRSVESLLNEICKFTNSGICCKKDNNGNLNC